MQDQSERPPLGSWARLYGLVAAVAIAAIVLLYWFTTTFNIQMPS